MAGSYSNLLAAISGILFFIPALALSRLSDQENKAKRLFISWGQPAPFSLLQACSLKYSTGHSLQCLLLIGIFLLCFLAFPMFTWLTWKEESHISSMFIFLVIGFILIVVPGAMVTLNLQHSYQAYYYPNNDQQNALYDYLFRNNNSLISKYHDSLNYHKMEQLHSKTTGILTVISNIQEKMVQESEGQPGKPAVSADQISQTKTGQEIYIQVNFQDHSTPDLRRFFFCLAVMPGRNLIRQLQNMKVT